MDDVSFLWQGWEPLARIVFIGTLGYVWLLLLLRGSGQRTLATMTPFDFIITVTLGSAFGRVLTAKDVSLAEVLVVMALLLTLQWLVADLRARSGRVAALVDINAVLLYHRGEIMHRQLRRHRLKESDLEGAARQNGYGSLSEVEAIVLEKSGTFSAIGHAERGDGAALRGLASS